MEVVIPGKWRVHPTRCNASGLSSQLRGYSASFRAVLRTRTTIPTQRICRKKISIYEFYLHPDNANNLFMVWVYKVSINICRKFSHIHLTGEDVCINTVRTWCRTDYLNSGHRSGSFVQTSREQSMVDDGFKIFHGIEPGVHLHNVFSTILESSWNVMAHGDAR